jgi:SAM-dependent methyltransferase
MNLTKGDVRGKKIIEIGSYNVNGSLRPIIESWKPAKYIGVDIAKGLGVDIVCGAEEITKKFGKKSFDIVISTELLEHVRDWKKVVSNIKNICKPGGTILITTRSCGFVYHPYPDDFWRFETKDMIKIFSDCEIKKLEKDKPDPGVFIKIKKPNKFAENNLSNYRLYSIITKKRVKKIDEKSLRDFRKMYFRKEKIRALIFQIGKIIFPKPYRY